MLNILITMKMYFYKMCQFITDHHEIKISKTESKRTFPKKGKMSKLILAVKHQKHVFVRGFWGLGVRSAAGWPYRPFGPCVCVCVCDSDATFGLFVKYFWACLAWLAWLACLLCPALAWSGPGLSCLPCPPCLGLVQKQQPAAFGGEW